MFHTFADDPATANDILSAHPLVITALKEDYWLNNPDAAGSPFPSWPRGMIDRIYNEFGINPGLQNGVGWDHLIYAFLLEKTGIVRIFEAVKRTFEASEPPPSVLTQQFWRNTNAILYARLDPYSVDYTLSHDHADETADRMSYYWRMFGLELGDDFAPGPDKTFKKDPSANENFESIFRVFASQVWIGILNSRNIAGRNDADDAAIATAALQLRDMLTTRRQNFNLLREEYRAVLLTSWLHLAIAYDLPMVQDLKVQASSADLRLAKMAKLVGMTAHPNTRALLQLAGPMSLLMRGIEADYFSDAGDAPRLYWERSQWRGISETVIEQYSRATGQNLKAQPIYSGRDPSMAPHSPAPVAIARPRPVGQIEAQRQALAIASSR